MKNYINEHATGIIGILFSAFLYYKGQTEEARNIFAVSISYLGIKKLTK